MLANGILQLRHLTLVGRDDQQAHAAHFIERAFAPTYALWRRAGVVRIFGRIVIRNPRMQPRSFRQRNRILELILILPGEVPVVDPQQFFVSPVGSVAVRCICLPK